MNNTFICIYTFIVELLSLALLFLVVSTNYFNVFMACNENNFRRFLLKSYHLYFHKLNNCRNMVRERNKPFPNSVKFHYYWAFIPILRHSNNNEFLPYREFLSMCSAQFWATLISSIILLKCLSKLSYAIYFTWKSLYDMLFRAQIALKLLKYYYMWMVLIHK